jgi:hypothetical protein
MSHDPLQRISQRTISEEELSLEISRLGGDAVPPSFWVAIANDGTFSPGHRAKCVCQLFERSIHGPIDIVDLARLLEGATWLGTSAITVVTHIRGELPVDWNLGEGVLAIHLFPGQTAEEVVLYLRLSRALAPEAFVQVMKNPQAQAAAAGISMLAAACSAQR